MSLELCLSNMTQLRFECTLSQVRLDLYLFSFIIIIISIKSFLCWSDRSAILSYEKEVSIIFY